MTLLGAAIAFTLKFLLDARDYPQLSILMLGVVAIFIGTMAFAGALVIWGVLFADFATSIRPIWQEASRKGKAGLVAIALPAVAAILVLVFIGWVTFHFSVQNLSASLGSFREHLQSQINQPQESATH